MTIRPLTEEDAPGGLRLSTQAGWNHLDVDWQRCITLCPRTTIGVFDDTLIATCSATPFGRLGWIGLFLVDEAHRRKGLGTRVFDALLTAGREEGIERIALPHIESRCHAPGLQNRPNARIRWACVLLFDSEVTSEEGTRVR